MSAQLYQLKIALRGSQPPIWRRVLVSEHIRLDALHAVIQAVMGWEDCHLHFFESRGVYYGPPGQGDRSERTQSLSQVAPMLRDRLSYVYDMGDSWTHAITVEKILEAGATVAVPSCLGGARACPPEDCGGMVGYVELLDCLADSDHPSHRDISAWVGPIEPEVFDLAAAQSRLDRLKPRARVAV